MRVQASCGNLSGCVPARSSHAAGELPDLLKIDDERVVDVSTTMPDAHEPAWA